MVDEMKKEEALDLNNQIYLRILADNPQAKKVNGKLRELACPVCGKKEAYAFKDNPVVIICPRDNNCGKHTKTSDLYPDLFTGFLEKHGRKEKKAARAYIKSRGLDPATIEFGQIIRELDGKEYAAITFPLADGKSNTGRLIDYTGKDKGYFEPGSSPSKTIYKPGKLKKSKPVYIVEGAFDALSLQQSGFQSIAILSSAYRYDKNPKLKKLIKKGYSFVITLDNDKAGKKAIKKLVKLFKKKKVNFEIALPPEGKDWNDLLLAGKLSKKDMERFRWQGDLFKAELEVNIEAYYSILRKKYEHVRLFEFNLCYYNLDDKGKFINLSDFVCKILYTVEDKTVEYMPTSYHIVETVSKREGTRRITIAGTDLAKNESFRTAVADQARLFWHGQPQHLQRLVQYLLRNVPPKIRGLGFQGHDAASDCYVFSNILYDKSGHKQFLNHEGYFFNQSIRPMQGQKIEFKEANLKQFFKYLKRAFGSKGLLIFGFYISAFFVHLIRKEMHWFPFMMAIGAPATGKSTLFSLLSKSFFCFGEEIPGGKASTKKGVLRTLAKKKSLVIVISESRQNYEMIDTNNILSLYDNGLLQIRAAFSNDGRTHELKNHSALAFVQNPEIYNMGAAKQRFLTFTFELDEITSESRDALDDLRKVADPAIGDQILSRRKEFESSLVLIIKEIQEKLMTKDGIVHERIAFNHAVAFAGLQAFCDIFGIKFKNQRKKVYEDLVTVARKKLENTNTESDLADDFFSTFEDLAKKGWNSSGDGVLKYGTHYVIDQGFVYIRLSQTLAAMADAGYRFPNTQIHEALRTHDASFVESRKSKRSKDWEDDPKNFKCWELKIAETGMTLDSKESHVIDVDAIKQAKRNKKGKKSSKTEKDWGGDGPDIE